ncbi:acyltransferase family protein [Cellulomonas flavigena]|nr:acyltransferase [Cellulomonas flavigena]
MRFVLAGAVVLYHLTATPTVSRYLDAPPATAFPALNEVSRYGWLGVQVFFVISGLVITRSAAHGSLRTFVTSRAVRLLPAYWACVVLTARLRLLWDDDRRPGAGEILLNLTMVQGQLGVPSLQVVFWTLLVELKFYLLVAAVLALGPLTRPRVLLLATVWPVLALVVELGLAQDPGGASGVALRGVAELLVPPFAAFFGAVRQPGVRRAVRRSPDTGRGERGARGARRPGPCGRGRR